MPDQAGSGSGSAAAEVAAVGAALRHRRTGASVRDLVDDTQLGSIAVILALEALTKDGLVRRLAEGTERRTWRYFTTAAGHAAQRVT